MKTDSRIRDLVLTDAEVADIRTLVDALAGAFHGVEDPEFLRGAGGYAWRLPIRLTSFVEDARLAEAPALRVLGWRVDDAELGATPTDSRPDGRPDSRPGMARHEFLLVLFASLLGDVFTFAPIQGGRLISYVCPLPGAEHSVTAGSSQRALEWHTEGAGLECRADHQAFLCLRNPDRVPTLIAALDPGLMPARTLAMLRQPRFQMPTLGPAGEITVRIAAIGGPEDRPYLRLDPVYLAAVPDDEEAAAALAAVNDVISASLVPLEQSPGDLYAIDNHLLVHGRPPFIPRYDGTDRWMLRTKTTRDLRRSAAYRESARSRLVRLYR